VAKAPGKAAGDDAALVRGAARRAALNVMNVLAGKTAKEYVEQLYLPAAQASEATGETICLQSILVDGRPLKNDLKPA
jgi:hypothetical protein